MIHGEMHQCIYCKEYKPAEDFNREHVVSRMLGTYQNAPVLNECQVCKSCNDYFCNEIENKLSMDSYEGFLRMQYDGRKHTKVRKIGQTRLVVSGQNGIFKGLDFLVSSNSNNGVGIQLEIEPVIGIISDASKQEYDYYHLGEIPPYSEEIHAKISSSPSPIVFFGVDQKDVEEELISKGYDLSNKKCTTDLDISDVTCEKVIETQIKCNIDSLLSRLAAKNLFNFLCYKYGKDFVLDKKYDNIRSFIRGGSVESPLKMCVNNGGLSGIPNRVENGHVIGTAWTATDKLCLMGFVSWFNSITYSFILKEWDEPKLIELHDVICDNSNHEIKEIVNPIVIDWPDSQFSIQCLDNAIRLVKKT